MTGIDLAPVQTEWVPPKCTFIIDDITLPWLDKDDSIDLIHVQQLHWLEDWPDLVKQAYRCLAPGGWFEWAEIQFTFNEHHHSWQQWQELQKDIYNRSGRSRVADNMEKILEDAGLHDIRREERPILGGERWEFRKHIDTEGMVAILHTACGMGGEDVFSLAAGMKRELLGKTSPVDVNAYVIILVLSFFIDSCIGSASTPRSRML